MNRTQFPVALSETELLALRVGAAAVGMKPGEFMRLGAWRTLADLERSLVKIQRQARFLLELEKNGGSGVQIGFKSFKIDEQEENR